MRYKVVLEESDEGFAVSVPSLPGCHSQGSTESEALEDIADAIREYLDAIHERRRPVNAREVEVEVQSGSRSGRVSSGVAWMDGHEDLAM